jgi:hypothetical protein
MHDKGNIVNTNGVFVLKGFGFHTNMFSLLGFVCAAKGISIFR